MKRPPLFTWLGLLLLLCVVVIPVAASPTISSVSPSSAPNNCDMDVTIRGTGFTEGSSVWISSCSTGAIVHGTVLSWSSTSIKCRFSFRGTKPGSYNLAVNSPFTDPAGGYYPNDACELKQAFEIYQGTGTTYTPTTTTGTTTTRTTVTTSATSGHGENSVFFETNPTGAEISVNGEHVGTSAFTYYTDRDGTFEVVARKLGYEDYVDRVTILSGGQRVRFYAQLTQLTSTTNTTTTNGTPSVSSSSIPGKTTTTVRKSTLKIPTPLGTDPPVTEESPANPATALWAAGIAIAFVLFRRR
jgi:hypothetical protein